MVTLLDMNKRQLFKISGAKINLHEKETGLIKPVDI